MNKITIERGGLWEFASFDIKMDAECSGYGIHKEEACKHCYDFQTLTHQRPDGSTYTEDVWKCPKAVVAYNEAGYNTTGICLDCLVEAASGLKERV